MAKSIIINMAAIDEGKKRADALGMNFAELMERCGLTARTFNGSSNTYKLSAKKNGWDTSKNYGIVNEENFKSFCIGFMLKAEDYIIISPEEEKKAETKTGPTLDDVCGLIEDMVVEQRKTNDQVKALIDFLASRRDLGEIEAKTGQIARILDAIDNKTMSTLTEVQKMNNKVDGIVKYQKIISDKARGLNDMYAGMLTKASKIATLLERFCTGK